MTLREAAPVLWRRVGRALQQRDQSARIPARAAIERREAKADLFAGSGDPEADLVAEPVGHPGQRDGVARHVAQQPTRPGPVAPAAEDQQPAIGDDEVGMALDEEPDRAGSAAKGAGHEREGDRDRDHGDVLLDRRLPDLGDHHVAYPVTRLEQRFGEGRQLSTALLLDRHGRSPPTSVRRSPIPRERSACAPLRYPIQPKRTTPRKAR